MTRAADQDRGRMPARSGPAAADLPRFLLASFLESGRFPALFYVRRARIRMHGGAMAAEMPQILASAGPAGNPAGNIRPLIERRPEAQKTAACERISERQAGNYQGGRI